MSDRLFPWEQLGSADLIVDAIYQGGNSGKGKSDEVLHRLLPGVSNSGGFRAVGGASSPPVVILYSSGVHPDWPDEFDLYRGTYSYFGDNRTPGRELHDTPRGGNKVLRDAFELAQGDKFSRAKCPFFLLFEKVDSRGHDVRFRGLAIPGTSIGNGGQEDLVAIWKVAGAKRFQNYRATFTILDAGIIDGMWLREIVANRARNSSDPRIPKALQTWIESGRFEPLTSPGIQVGRTPEEQTPQDSDGKSLISSIRGYCQDDDFLFEIVAAEIWSMTVNEPITWQLTRKYRDGGRDAVGQYVIGPLADRLTLTFSLEAKNYAPTNGVGVREISRLISRIRHREFGVLVTTSYLAKQAYDEIRIDGHPIVVVSATDIVSALNRHGISTVAQCDAWLSSLIDTRN